LDLQPAFQNQQEQVGAIGHRVVVQHDRQVGCVRDLLQVVQGLPLVTGVAHRRQQHETVDANRLRLFCVNAGLAGIGFGNTGQKRNPAIDLPGEEPGQLEFFIDVEG